ncbi:GNAT family N-acetyltransferase [Zunongwangia sp. F260]|uniref:GNAT family N-acetyltransferase n=1 Tax=Autumnicola lenta TaxID=3075593 RepID=A0ABU3CHT4_9FLAO|nr:GNAT family N-acetyltransferase [Zunongwangia sp. F260]MDT0645904.1 GNAT family N-acetyltransferase [Zunongwangia sp. F260]
MLEFRKINYEEDLDQVINLIQKGLDPNFTPELFKWKHLENPFGKSYGLLALDGDQIVGLRMFMYWEFKYFKEQKTIKAIRPVDTVVDKDYRGQGLFKRLSLTGLDECRGNYKIIFNTPNENSLPGYLKMGWQRLEQVNYFRTSLMNPLLKSLQYEDIEAGAIDFEEQTSRDVSTYRSSVYFKWRYKNDPYKIAFFPEEKIYVAYRTSKTYLIVCEVFGNNGAVSYKVLNSLAKNTGKYLIYYYNNECFKKFNLLVTFKRKKPVIVVRNHEHLNISGSMDFSLADLEAIF